MSAAQERLITQEDLVRFGLAVYAELHQQDDDSVAESLTSGALTQIALDIANAMLIANPSATRAAIVESFGPLVSDALADADTSDIVAGAVGTAITNQNIPGKVTAAVASQTNALGLLRTRPGRAPAPYQDAVNGITDENGKMRWVQWRKDGGIPVKIAELFIGIRVMRSGRFLWSVYWQNSGTVIFGMLRTGRFYGFPGNGTAARQARFIPVGGQSNAVGKADDPNPILDPPHPRVFMADATGQLVTAADPIITADSLVRKGFVFEFGRLMAEKYPNDDIILVSYALGGTGFYHPDETPAQRWNPTAGGNLFNGWLNKIGLARSAAVAKYQTVVYGPIVWHQIEADRSHTEQEYAVMIDALIDGVRNYLGDQTIPFLLGAPAPEYVDTWVARTALYGLMNTPARKTRCAYATSQYGWVGPDGIHFNRAGYDRLARSYAAALPRAVRNVTGQAPELVLSLTARRVGADVLVSWEAPVGRVKSYLIDWNPSATATAATSGWVTTGVTQGTTLETAARITAPVASPVGAGITVRVRAVNDDGTSLPNTYAV